MPDCRSDEHDYDDEDDDDNDDDDDDDRSPSSHYLILNGVYFMWKLCAVNY